MMAISKDRPLNIFTDGASRGNPGPSAIGFIFVIGDQSLYHKSVFIGEHTNNQAEYHAIIDALSEASRFTRGEVHVFSDSELVIKQLNGDYQVKKPHLTTLFKKVLQMKKLFKTVEFFHVSRDNYWITEVDKLCNKCLNTHSK